MAFVLGRNCKLYRQTTGTRAAWPASGAAPNLDLVPNSRDIGFDVTKSTNDVTTRGGTGWNQFLGGLKDATLTIQMVYDTADTDWAAMMASYLNDTLIALAILDGVSSTVGTQGWWADFVVTNMSEPQPIDGAVMTTFTLKVGYSAVAPERITVGA